MISVADLVKYLGDDCVKVVGRKDLIVSCVRPINGLETNCLSFFKGIDADWISGIPKDLNCVVVVPKGLALPENLVSALVLIHCENPRLSFLRLLDKYFRPALTYVGVHPSACIADGVRLGENVVIGPNCYVAAGTVIGTGTVIHANVSIICPAKIGSNVRIFPGSVIGADGFGYERNAAGGLEGFPHVGSVVIEDDVHIGSNTCIDRGTLADTVICTGARIDNLVHVAHNVRVGAHSAIIAHAMIGGSVDVGEGAWIAPAAVILNKLKIGERALVGMGAVAVKNVPANETVLGSPAISLSNFRKIQAKLREFL